MIAGARRHDAPCAFLGSERAHQVDTTPHLERPRRVVILVLHPDVETRRLVEQWVLHERRGGQVRTKAGSSGVDVLQGGRKQGCGVLGARCHVRCRVRSAGCQVRSAVLVHSTCFRASVARAAVVPVGSHPLVAGWDRHIGPVRDEPVHAPGQEPLGVRLGVHDPHLHDLPFVMGLTDEGGRHHAQPARSLRYLERHVRAGGHEGPAHPGPMQSPACFGL